VAKEKKRKKETSAVKLGLQID